MTDHNAQGPTGGLTPHITVSDGAAAIDFYARAFGARELARMVAEDGKRLMHAHLRINDGSLMLHDDFPEYRGGAPAGAPEGVALHLQVDDTDRWFARAVEAGATGTMPPADMFWGDRYAMVRDPFGHSWGIGAALDGGEQA